MALSGLFYRKRSKVSSWNVDEIRKNLTPEENQSLERKIQEAYQPLYEGFNQLDRQYSLMVDNELTSSSIDVFLDAVSDFRTKILNMTSMDLLFSQLTLIRCHQHGYNTLAEKYSRFTSPETRLRNALKDLYLILKDTVSAKKVFLTQQLTFELNQFDETWCRCTIS